MKLLSGLILLSFLATLVGASQYSYNARIDGTLTLKGIQMQPLEAGAGISLDSGPITTVVSFNSSTLTCPITMGQTTGCALSLGQADPTHADSVFIASQDALPTAANITTTVEIGHGAYQSDTSSVTAASQIDIGPASLTTGGASAGAQATAVINIGAGSVTVGGSAAADSASLAVNIATGFVSANGRSTVTLGSSFGASSIQLQAPVAVNADLTVANTKAVKFVDGSSNTLTIVSPATLASQTWTLPGTAANDGDLLTYQSAGSALMWQAPPTPFNPTSCPAFGLSSGCVSGSPSVISIGQASGTASDTVEIADTATTGGIQTVQIASQTTGTSAVKIGTATNAASLVLIRAGSTGGVSLSSTLVNLATALSTPTVNIATAATGATATVNIATGTSSANVVTIGSSNQAGSTVTLVAGSTNGIRLNADTTLGSGFRLRFTSNSVTTSFQGSGSAVAATYTLPPSVPASAPDAGYVWSLTSEISGVLAWVETRIAINAQLTTGTTSGCPSSPSFFNGDTALIYSDFSSCNAFSATTDDSSYMAVGGSGIAFGSNAIGMSFLITFSASITTTANCGFFPRIQSSTSGIVGFVQLDSNLFNSEVEGGAETVTFSFPFTPTATTTLSLYGTSTGNCNGVGRITVASVNFKSSFVA